MFLVHPRKDRPGKWEVAWMWLPHFLAADQALHKYIDEEMTKAFKGEQVVNTDLFDRMNGKVVDLIVEKYPIQGMRRFLVGYVHLTPEETIELTPEETIELLEDQANVPDKR
jgi:hypothetical protein